MPAVKPFRGLLFDQTRAPIAKVATEPYDKISVPMQKEYALRHPFNFVHLILDAIHPSDDAKNNRYTRSARRLKDWIRRGVLQPDSEPAFYLYEQTFRVRGLGKKTRRGIIGLMRLENFSKGNVLPHEHTLAKPRKDRMSLLKATKANLEQIFLLYEDSKQALEKKLEHWSKGKPFMQFDDDKGVQQRVWKITRPADRQAVSRFLSARKLFIADGHHRYTISEMFHRKVKASKSSAALKEASSWRMATFVNMYSPGLVILPTHRAVAMPSGWDCSRLLEDLREDFDVQELSVPADLVKAAGKLMAGVRRGGASGPCFGLLTKKRMAVLTLRRDGRLKERLRGLEKQFQALDVALLHHLILDKRMDICSKSVEKGGQISYIREPEDVARKISSGECSVGFLQNSADIEQVRRIARAGQCMPQKSTDFYPKLLSGLVVYDMEGRDA